jgi:beta-1,2-mannosidase
MPALGAEPALPDWAIGPFTRPANAQPVIRPNAASVFDCPMRGAGVHWEKLHTFNPAAVVRNGKVYVLYRAEDDSGEMQIGGHTSRMGLAIGGDGLHFLREPRPVLFPALDGQRAFEWTGGCEDPRLAERGDGTYVVLYTQYTGAKEGKVRLGLASSKDLIDWTKHGSPFSGTKYENWTMKSAAIVHEVVKGRLIAAKIKGKYWMYFGEHSVHAATSDDLISWKPVEDAAGEPLEVMLTRPGSFDSGLTEIGPQAIRTARGIVVFYNGKNNDPAKDGDPELPNGVYSCGQALFSGEEPTRLITRLGKPFFRPELAWEKTGQYAAGTTFSEGLVLFKGQWLLYYGCADTFVGVAVAKARLK